MVQLGEKTYRKKMERELEKIREEFSDLIESSEDNEEKKKIKELLDNIENIFKGLIID